jgi:hypothetical protein
VEIRDIETGEDRYSVDTFFPEPTHTIEHEDINFESNSDCATLNNSEIGSVVSNEREGCVAQFIAPTSIDQGYSVVIDRNFHGGWVCIGYIPTELQSLIEDNPNESYFERGTTFCTDDS